LSAVNTADLFFFCPQRVNAGKITAWIVADSFTAIRSSMNRVAGLVIFVGLALPSFLPVGAQLRSPLDPVEPFAIKPGSSFMASGGSISAVEPSRPSAIGSDLREAIQLIRQNHIEGRSLDPNEMTKTALDGMLRSLDPHSNFYDAAEWKDLMDEQRSSYSGIGASIAGFEKDGVIETYVIATFANSPAARAQLHFGDKILAIDGQRMKDRASEAVRDQTGQFLYGLGRINIGCRAVNAVGYRL
jgi:hypothetical protein